MNENDKNDWKISKAPPPITPVRGSAAYRPPELKPENWKVWGFVRQVSFVDGMLLSVGIDPDEVARGEAFKKVALSRLPATFFEHVTMCQGELSEFGGPVKLRDVAEFLIRCGRTVPDEMRNLAQASAAPQEAVAKTEPIARETSETAKQPAPVAEPATRWRLKKMKRNDDLRNAIFTFLSLARVSDHKPGAGEVRGFQERDLICQRGG